MRLEGQNNSSEYDAQTLYGNRISFETRRNPESHTNRMDCHWKGKQNLNEVRRGTLPRPSNNLEHSQIDYLQHAKTEAAWEAPTRVIASRATTKHVGHSRNILLFWSPRCTLCPTRAAQNPGPSASRKGAFNDRNLLMQRRSIPPAGSNKRRVPWKEMVGKQKAALRRASIHGGKARRDPPPEENLC